MEERFGPTLASEKLAELRRLGVSPETLRRWLLAAGLWDRVRQRDVPATPGRGGRVSASWCS